MTSERGRAAPVRVTRDQVLRYRARVGHLDEKLPAGAFAAAAWGGLQDTAPRSGVLSLHVRVRDTQPDAVIRRPTPSVSCIC